MRRQLTTLRRRLEPLLAAAAILAAMAVACPAVALAQAPPTRGQDAADPGSATVARLIATHAETRGLYAHAMALRIGVVESGSDPVLARIPGGSAQQAPPGLWQGFFENALVTLGRLRSPVPAALYYNPLLDVALITLWENADGAWRVAAVKALPGERFDDPSVKAAPRPLWTRAETDPTASLSDTSAGRLAAFYRAHPPESQAGARFATTFAADAADARAAWPRLLWNARQRARWAAGRPAWLSPTLARITAALSSSDADSVTTAAPATDPKTAEAVASLPEELAQRLVLDMVLGAGGNERLLIGSLPDDGELYFLVLCRLEAEACGLRRIMMVSLIDHDEPSGSTARRTGG